jgi:hypothetical protein
VHRRAFSEYLSESLEQIERHVPDIYALVGRCLGRRGVRLEVGSESTSLRVDLDNRIEPDVESAAAEEIFAKTTRATIVALARGEATLEQALVDEAVHLRGAVEDLAAGMDALAAYLNGAARCPELLTLMEAFRADSSGGGRA